MVWDSNLLGGRRTLLRNSTLDHSDNSLFTHIMHLEQKLKMANEELQEVKRREAILQQRDSQLEVAAVTLWATSRFLFELSVNNSWCYSFNCSR